MSINLLKEFTESISGDLMSKASSFLGEDTSSINKGLSAAAPALLGALVKTGSSKSGAETIMNLLKSGGFDGSLMSNAASLLGNQQKRDGMLSQGSSLLSTLLGNNMASVTDLISNASGMKKGSTSSFMKMLAPMLMSMLGKKVMGGNMNISGLMDMLQGQKSHIQKAAPGGLSSLMGFADWGKDAVTGAADKVVETTKKTARTTADVAEDVAEKGKSGLAKILPLLLLLLLAAFALYTWKSCQEKNSMGDVMKDATEEVVSGSKKAVTKGAEAVGDAGKAVKDGAKAVGDAITSISLPGGAEIKAAVGGFTDNIVKVVSGKGDVKEAIAFDGVNFKTGSAELTEDSDVQLSNLAKIMDAYPKSTIRIEGHTDNTGDAQSNLDLSKKRAAAVKAALVKKGVDESRIETKGRGQSSPIASNDTEEGKKQNRRVEVYVVKR